MLAKINSKKKMSCQRNIIEALIQLQDPEIKQEELTFSVCLFCKFLSHLRNLEIGRSV